jgi:hypothetical protein
MRERSNIGINKINMLYACRESLLSSGTADHCAGSDFYEIDIFI